MGLLNKLFKKKEHPELKDQLSGKRVFVGDTSIAEQAVMRQALTQYVEDITCYADGETLQRKIFEKHPDIVIVSTALHIRNGYEIAEQIKSDEKFKNVTIILTVESTDDLDHHRFEKCGADASITKPVDEDKFANYLLQYI